MDATGAVDLTSARRGGAAVRVLGVTVVTAVVWWGLVQVRTPTAWDALVVPAGVVLLVAALHLTTAVLARRPAYARAVHWWAERVRRPLVMPLAAIESALERGLALAAPSAHDASERREASAAQFRDVVRQGTMESREQRDLLLGAVDFGGITAAEVMTPRVDMVALDRETPWSEVIDRVRSARHSRVPVFQDTVDEVIGIVYAKDLLPAVIADTEPDAGWQSLVRPALFIPQAKRILDLLREFRASGCHLAIVVDEFGGTAGLVTIEDVLEELVGEIRDEYDSEDRQVESEDGGRYWVSGQLTLDDLSESLGHDFRREDITTVGGLVMELCGRVPRAGEALDIGPFRAIVERVVRRKVARVYFERRIPAGMNGA